MATAMSAKPPAHPPKMKRPPPPLVQTSVNGVKPSQSSPSAASSSKRPPGLKQPPTAPATNGVVVNGTAVRSTNRQRKESQRPGDAYARLNRLSTRGVGMEGNSVDRKNSKKFPEPYVKNTSHILKKYAKCPPSLILHLHPTHFRFDQQDGSFGYNSPMKVILEHVKHRTLPHDMIGELRNAGVRFFEGCLIVKVVDHKSSPTSTSSSSSTSSDDKNAPFSVHNYTPYLVPSPYAPYPLPNQTRPSKEPPPSDSPKPPNGEASSSSATNGDASAVKDSEPPPETSNDSESRRSTAEPRVFHTVLFPTELSKQADLTIASMTPDPRALNRRQSQAFAASRTPGSATMPHPPTPLSAVPQTPINERGPVAKRQKMMLEAKDVPDFEARIVNSMAAPLYLEPAESLQVVQNVLKMLESPLHNYDPPPPKTRKRTIAELAADEALAAEEERFMLIMDERLAPATSSAAAGAKSAATDGQTGATSFEPRFSRFKTLENIRLQHDEKAKREHERKVQQDHIKRQQQEEQDRERKRQLAQRQQEELASREDMRNRQEFQARQHAQVQARMQIAAQHAMQQAHQNQQAVPQVNGMMPVPHQTPQMMHASQAQHSSPVIRSHTPHNSSPLVGNVMGTQPQSVPMNITSSGQGAGSPPRPGSALQHVRPGVSAPMGHPMAQSRSQQPPSRNGTPQMPQGTPAMPHSTPVPRNVTPIQRMTHSSPTGSTAAHTPVPMMAAQHINGMNLTPQQQQQMLHRQQIMAQQQQMQQNHANGQPQFSPHQLAEFQARQQQQAQHAQQIQAQQAVLRHQQQQQQAAQQQQQHQAGLQPSGGIQQFRNQHDEYNAQVRRAMEAQMNVTTQQQTHQQQQLAQMQQQQHNQRQQQQQQQQQMQAHQHPQHPGQQGSPPQNMQPQMDGGGGQPQQQLNPQSARTVTQNARVHALVNQRATALFNENIRQLQASGQPINQQQIERMRHAMMEKAKKDVQEFMRRDGMARQQQQAQQQAMMQQQQQQQGGGQMMGGGMGMPK